MEDFPQPMLQPQIQPLLTAGMPRASGPGAVRVLPARERIQWIDVLRGLVIVVMVLDHVRHFLHESAYAYDPLDPAHTTVLLYVTRWITHLCAPSFVFLAGVSVWLQRARGKGRRELAIFLVKRGCWLILVEVALVSFALEF